MRRGPGARGSRVLDARGRRGLLGALTDDGAIAAAVIGSDRQVGR